MTDTVRVLITGSREFTDRPTMAAAINLVRREHAGAALTIVHGAARGADSIASAICRDNPGKLIEEPHPVTDWQRPDGSRDRAAGHRRNQRMVYAGAVVCLAFLDVRSENRGTRSCMQNATVAGIEVREHWGSDA